MLPLVRVLQRYSVRCDLFVDWAFWPWGDKSAELRKERVQAGVEYLLSQGVDFVILPPVLELATLLGDDT